MTIDAVTWELVSYLACPRDQGELTREGDALRCVVCAATYPLLGERLVSFLSPEEIDEQARREIEGRDEESSWYDELFEGYADAVELPTTLARIGRPTGPVLDHGAGTGRFSAALVERGLPVIAADYSAGCLRLLLERVGDAPVLAVQSDVRQLPLRTGAMAAAVSGGLICCFRSRDDRRQVLSELARVLAPSAPLAISSLNYNLLFKAWRAMGNPGAKEGDHLFGGEYPYVRQTRDELRDELEEAFVVHELTGIRNIPARSMAGAVRRVGFGSAADRFLDWMVRRGRRLDIAIEMTPAARQLGFMWLAKATRKQPEREPAPLRA